MTRLYNLESYSELCAYTNLYDKKVESSLTEYKNFLDEYKNQGYCINSIHPQELSFRDEPISIEHLGIELSKDSHNVYIIPDRINSLSLSNILKSGEDYIYKSVYHYWNYCHQIANNIDLTQPVVIIDLNSLSNESYCYLQFEQHNNSNYYIPIIDNRTQASEDFKLPLELKDIHNNIYYALAQEILIRNFPKLADNQDTIEYLKSYLQKIQIFKIAQGSDNFSLIAEIYYQEKVYYKSVILNTSLLEAIVTDKINFKLIAEFTNQHSDNSFILISDYNFLPKFREVLNNSNIFLPDNRLAEFPKIWIEKQQQNFPLFGQYLDKIKFKILKNNQEQWIEVLSIAEQDHIYYEGDLKSRTFIARIQETGQDYFNLSSLHTILPIKINNQDYCINGKIQEYKITHPCSELKELTVRIEFIVKLGSVPELRVIDRENKYKIEAKLCPPEESGYIPLNTILENRVTKNCFIPSSEKLQQFIDALSPIQDIDSFNTVMKFQNNIKRAYNVIKKDNNNPDLFLNLAYNDPSIEPVKEKIQQLNSSGIVEQLRKYIKGNYTFSPNQAIQNRQSIGKLIIFLGKTYKLSKYLKLKPFFNSTMIESVCKNQAIPTGEYFLFLSRTALTLELQLNYFKVFSNVWVNNQPLYQYEKYLWGYSRILFWYFEFNDRDDINYQEHFSKILNYLLIGTKLNQGYKQNAFLALIYLFTFRNPSLNPEFCLSDSPEYKLAKDVVDKYKDQPVRLNAIGDKPLNKYFEELLKYQSSQKDIGVLIKLD